MELVEIVKITPSAEQLEIKEVVETVIEIDEEEKIVTKKTTINCVTLEECFPKTASEEDGMEKLVGVDIDVAHQDANCQITLVKEDIDESNKITFDESQTVAIKRKKPDVSFDEELLMPSKKANYEAGAGDSESQERSEKAGKEAIRKRFLDALKEELRRILSDQVKRDELQELFGMSSVQISELQHQVAIMMDDIMGDVKESKVTCKEAPVLTKEPCIDEVTKKTEMKLVDLSSLFPEAIKAVKERHL